MPLSAHGIRKPVLSDTANVPRDIGYAVDDIDALFTAYEAAWAAYTPTVTVAGGGFSLGNGTAVGRYKQVGKAVTAIVTLTFGSTTAFGSGILQVAAPVTARAGAIYQGVLYGFNAGVNVRVGAAQVNGATISGIFDQANQSQSVTYPWTLKSGDVLTYQVTFEAA